MERPSRGIWVHGCSHTDVLVGLAVGATKALELKPGAEREGDSQKWPRGRSVQPLFLLYGLNFKAVRAVLSVISFFFTLPILLCVD